MLVYKTHAEPKISHVFNISSFFLCIWFAWPFYCIWHCTKLELKQLSKSIWPWLYSDPGDVTFWLQHSTLLRSGMRKRPTKRTNLEATSEISLFIPLCMKSVSSIYTIRHKQSASIFLLFSLTFMFMNCLDAVFFTCTDKHPRLWIIKRRFQKLEFMLNLDNNAHLIVRDQKTQRQTRWAITELFCKILWISV